MSLHVEIAGHGRDLVLLHGWGLHSGAWDEVAPALAKRARVHAIDLPGHGHSRAIPVESFDEAADAVAAHVPQDAVVCGWSLGALFAQRLARRHPARVARMALVAATPCFAARPGWEHAMAASTIEAFARDLARDCAATLARFVRLNALNGARDREAVRAFTARLAGRGAPAAGALAASLRWLREVDLRDDAQALGQPAVVLHGARDAIVPVEAGRWLARRIPGARLHELADAAHLPFFTHREAFLAALEPLLA